MHWDKETRLTIAICLSTLFMFVEIAGGLWANSLAILSDAAHLLTDIMSFVIALVAVKITKWPASRNFSFGYARAEVLGALGSITLIWLLTFGLIWEAMQRIYDWTEGDMEEVDGKIMSMVAVFGIFVNIFLAVIFSGDGEASFSLHSHDHVHGHEHGHVHGHGHEEEHKESYDTHERSQHALLGGSDKQIEMAEMHSPLSLPESKPARYEAVQDDENDSSHGHDHGQDHDHDHDHAHAHAHRHNGDDKHAMTGDSHGHGHGHIYGEGVEQCEPAPRPIQRDMNMNAVYLHVLTDLMQSAGVFVSGVVVWNDGNFRIVDPLITLVFALVIISSTFSVLGKVFGVLCEGVPESVDYNRVCTALNGIDGVVGCHHLHIWSLSSSHVSLSCHLQILPLSERKPENTNQCILDKAHTICLQQHIDHITVQLEENDLCAKASAHSSCF